MHIAIAGNIGSGKTTLTQMLAHHYGWLPCFEQVVENPYLADYYENIPRWAFALEVFFLKERFRDLLAIARSPQTVVQDRSIFEGVYVFTRNNYEHGNLSKRDYETYMELFELMTDTAGYPDLMIYLRASVPHLVENIRRRGRDFEMKMHLEYLQSLNERYDDFIYQQYKGRVLTVNVDPLDFQNNPLDFAFIVDKIDHQLFGFFH
ncbi:MAG: deoxynucleoside kinase [Prevotella sp.]|nr:deoxynucleoside kinase [Prevotella sp.]